MKLHFPECTQAGSADLDWEMFLISCPTCMEMTPVDECLIFPLSGDLEAVLRISNNGMDELA